MNAGNSSSPYFTLTLPNQFLTYTVRVVAVNTKGRTKGSDLLHLVAPCVALPSGTETGALQTVDHVVCILNSQT